MIGASDSSHPLASIEGDNSVAWLDIDRATFKTHFPAQPFFVAHHLCEHPLLKLPRIIELARFLPPKEVKHQFAKIDVGGGIWSGPRNGLSPEETLRQIEACESWMVLKSIEADRDYKQLLDNCLDQIQALSENVRPGMSLRAGFIFVSSPRSVTAYHIDPEHNFLLQIRGSKTIHMWDRDDRSVISSIEREQYFSGRKDQIEFRPEYAAKAMQFELKPGMGLHFPVAAPHWVQNGDEVSVSLSITFRTASSEQERLAENSNEWVRRRLGLNPRPYAGGSWRDATKAQWARVRQRLQKKNIRRSY